MIGRNVGYRLAIAAGADRHEVRLDLGDLQVGGLAGPGPVTARFSEYVSNPDDFNFESPSFDFLATHDVVDLQRVGPDGRVASVVGCRLVDLVFIESESGNRAQYHFIGEKVDGDFFSRVTR